MAAAKFSLIPFDAPCFFSTKIEQIAPNNSWWGRNSLWRFIKTLFRAGTILIAGLLSVITITGLLSKLLNNISDIKKQAADLGVIDRGLLLLDELWTWLKGLDWSDYLLFVAAYVVLFIAAWFLHTKSFEEAKTEFEQHLESRHPGLTRKISRRRRRRNRGRNR